MKTQPLPIAVHDHFSKANVLHGYVEEHLGKAQEHAMELGDELLAAKEAIPHGSWEDECDRLFDPSARTARFYMQFARDMGALPKRQRTAILMIEGTLDGAAKAAKKAAKPKSPKATPEPNEPIDVDSEPVDAPETPEPPKRKGQPPRQFDRSYWMKQWEQAIGPLCRLPDKIEDNVGDSECGSKKVVLDHLNLATEEMTEWMGK